MYKYTFRPSIEPDHFAHFLVQDLWMKLHLRWQPAETIRSSTKATITHTTKALLQTTFKLGDAANPDGQSAKA